ncbi:unnamed protein product [Victoria cruziana]
MAISATSSPLLGGNADGGGGYYVEGAIDFKGRRAVRSRSGGWRCSFFIIGSNSHDSFFKSCNRRDGCYRAFISIMFESSFRFLNKAAIPLKSDHLASQKRSSWLICSVAQVEEGSTFFTKQASTMDRTIGPSFVFPAAALQGFIGVSIILFIPIYEGILVPLARHFTGISSGITVLQRLGAGMFLSALYMAVAALVERRRLEIAREAGLIDLPRTTVPMKIWWLLPQYLIWACRCLYNCGIARVLL